MLLLPERLTPDALQEGTRKRQCSLSSRVVAISILVVVAGTIAVLIDAVVPERIGTRIAVRCHINVSVLEM